MDYLLIWRNLLRNRKRTALTVLAVAVSMFIFCGLLSVVTVMRNLLSEAESSSVLGVRNYYSWVEGVIPDSYAERVRRVPGVQLVCPLNFVNAFVAPGRPNLFGLAADPATVRDIFPELREIPEPSYQDFLRERTGALMGREKMETFGWKVGDTVTLRGSSIPVDIPVKITGVIPYGGLADNFIIRRDYYEELATDKGNLNFILLKISPDRRPAEMIRTLDATFRDDAVKVKTETVKNVLLALVGQVNDLLAIIFFIALIILASTLLLASNSIAMSMRERRRELAVLRTIGYTPRRVMALVLGEALATVMTGGVVASVAAYLIFYYVGFNFQIGPQKFFTMPPEAFFEGLLVCAALGLLSGLAPAIGAARTGVADALRRIG